MSFYNPNPPQPPDSLKQDHDLMQFMSEYPADRFYLYHSKINDQITTYRASIIGYNIVKHNDPVYESGSRLVNVMLYPYPVQDKYYIELLWENVLKLVPPEGNIIVEAKHLTIYRNAQDN